MSMGGENESIGPTPMASGTCSTLHYVKSDASPSDEIDMEQAAALLGSGQLNGNSFVWTEGMPEWAKLSDCASLFSLSLDAMKLHYETTTSLPSEVVTVAQLKELLAQGVVGVSTLVWAEGMSEWSRLGDCHSFFGLAKGAVVASQPVAAVAAQAVACTEPDLMSTTIQPATDFANGRHDAGAMSARGAAPGAARAAAAGLGCFGSPSPEPEGAGWARGQAQAEAAAAAGVASRVLPVMERGCQRDEAEREAVLLALAIAERRLALCRVTTEAHLMCDDVTARTALHLACILTGKAEADAVRTTAISICPLTAEIVVRRRHDARSRASLFWCRALEQQR
eukprot:SAG11_NODE_4367_length_1931_cov_1.400655_2_plen_339_part_00